MDIGKFSKAWTVKNKTSGEVCLISTKYYLFAYASREATQKYQNIDSTEFNSINEKEYLAFAIYVLGDNFTFASDLHSVIKIDSVIIQPIENNNKDYASFIGGDSYSALCLHLYDPEEITSDAPIQLIVIKDDGKEVIYDIDLSKIK